MSRKKKSAVGLDGKGVRPDELIHTGLIHLETRAVSVCENPPERVFSLQVVLGERAGVRVPALVAVSGG